MGRSWFCCLEALPKSSLFFEVDLEAIKGEKKDVL
jgi:hypothetical protein